MTGIQAIGLAWGDGGDTLGGRAIVHAHGMVLDAAQISQGRFGRQIATGSLETLERDAVQDQRHEATAITQAVPAHLVWNATFSVAISALAASARCQFDT